MGLIVFFKPFLIFNKQKFSIKILNLQLKEQHFQTKISQNIELFTKNYKFEKIKILKKIKIPFLIFNKQKNSH